MSHEWYDVDCPSFPIPVRSAYCTVSHEYAALLWVDHNRWRWLTNRTLLVVSNGKEERLFRVHLSIEEPPTIVETTKSCYVVQLNVGVWITKMEGDPGRTLVFESAQRFKSQRGAKNALKTARTYRPYSRALILRLAVDEVPA